MPVQTQVQMRRDTAVNWTSANPVLASGEWGIETDTRLVKIGNGSSAWNSLSYSTGPALDEVIPTDPTGAYFTGSGFNCYGVVSNYASAPDAAALDITGDIDLIAKVAMTDWTPSSGQSIFGKWTDLQKSYALQVNSSGSLVFLYTTDGNTNISRSSTVATGISDGSTKWVRVTLDADNGSAQNEVKFYLSDDGSTWTQLGNTVTNAGTVTMFSGTALLQMGAVFLGSNSPMNGTLYRVIVKNGINGTTAFDANFETVAADSFAFTESSANAATVTLTTTRYSFGVPGATLTGASTAAVNQNTTYYFPFTVRGKPITLKHFAVECTTAGASNVTSRIAIHLADNQLQPTGAPIIQSGAFTVSNTGAAIYRIRVTPTVLNPGNYLILFNVNNGFTGRYWFNPNVFAPNTLGANLIALRSVSQTLSGDFPTTPVKWNVASGANSAGRHYVLLGWS